MFRFCFIIATLLVTWNDARANDSLSTLQLVQLVHRHGDRTPTSGIKQLYPISPYANVSMWPRGWGHLTNGGMVRMFELGKYFRRRYSGFLSTNPFSIYVFSDDEDRCLKSAAQVLAGMMPPEGIWKWNNDLNWQPIAIETGPHSVNYLNTDAHCRAADVEYERVKESSYVKQLNAKYSNLLKFLSEKTGANKTNIFQIESVYDDLFILRVEKNVTEWANDDLMRQMKEISGLVFYLGKSTKLLQRLRAGVLLKHLRDNIRNVIDGTNRKVDSVPHTLYEYSAHDDTLAALLTSLDAFNKIPPPYGSTVIIELHKDHVTSEYTIKLFYLNDTRSEDPILLKLKICEEKEFCTYDEFATGIEDLIPTDWHRECQSVAFYMQTTYFVVIPVLLYVLLCVGFILVSVHWRSTKLYSYKSWRK